ncbi:MAG: hypothetical protein JRI26_11925, partial [Deltaproteobacteria bacterium]|nr:hypothetical protein [Deltaproteobacteria bacterium]
MKEKKETRMKGKELMKLRKNINPKKATCLPVNNVFVEARDHDAKRIGIYCMEHDGSEEDIIKTAKKLMGELGNYIDYSG